MGTANERRVRKPPHMRDKDGRPLTLEQAIVAGQALPDGSPLLTFVPTDAQLRAASQGARPEDEALIRSGPNPGNRNAERVAARRAAREAAEAEKGFQLDGRYVVAAAFLLIGVAVYRR